MPQTHTIHRLSLSLQLPGHVAAMPLQERLRVQCREDLVPLLEALFELWAPPGEILRITKLEIDLGVVTAATLEKDFVEQVITFMRDRYGAAGMHTMQPDPGISRITLPAAQFDYWLHYLETGFLPAHTTPLPLVEWEQLVLETLASSSTAVERCKKVLRQTPARQRLVQQSSATFLVQWMAAFGAQRYRDVVQQLQTWEQEIYHSDFPAKINTQWQGMPLQFPPEATFRELCYNWLITEYVLPERAVDGVKLLREITLRMVGGQHTPQWLDVCEAALSPGAKSILLPAVHSLQQEYRAQPSAPPIPPHENITTTPTRPEQTRPSDDIAKQHNTTTNATDSTTPKQTTAATNEPAQQPVETDPQATQASPALAQQPADIPDDVIPASSPDVHTALYIKQAGLVLLHPFLPAFFKDLGLVEGNQFRDEQACHKAVHLLHFLAGGEMEQPDFALVFPKLLCGLRPAQSMQRFVTLTETEKNAAQSLLQDVIEHWNALGHTSADGLRGNFLLREGRLQEQDAEWRLRVTQQPYDLLLERLPWSFSIIKLPWMPWFLKTEWA